MKTRIAALACALVLTSSFPAGAVPAAAHITGGGVGTGTCATVIPFFPNPAPAPPIAAPPCVGTATAAIAGVATGGVPFAWHSDYGACGPLCGAYVVTILYTDLCPVAGAGSPASGAGGSISVTGEGDGDIGVETFHVDYALTRAGLTFAAVLFGAFIDMDGDSPAAPDGDSDVAIHDPTGLSGDSTGTVIPMAVPAVCGAGAPLAVTIVAAAEIRGT